MKMFSSVYKVLADNLDVKDLAVFTVLHLIALKNATKEDQSVLRRRIAALNDAASRMIPPGGASFDVYKSEAKSALKAEY